jgi:hypothetical protein
MSPDEILNMGVIDEETYSAGRPLRPQVLIALPSTRPIRIEACTYQDYLDQTNYPVPDRVTLTASEDLMPSHAIARDYIEQLPEAVQQMEAVLDAISESTSAALASGSLAKPEYPPIWYVPIVINCLVDGVVENRVYKPDSSLARLEELMIEYEEGSKIVCDSLSDLEVAKLAAWLEKSAEQEAIGERDEKQKQIDEQPIDTAGPAGPAVAAAAAAEVVAKQLTADSVVVADAHEAEVQVQVEPAAVPGGEIVGDEIDIDREQDQERKEESERGIDLGIQWG